MADNNMSARGMVGGCLILAGALALLNPGAAAAQQNTGQDCDEDIIELAGKHLGADDFDFPEDGMYPGANNGGVIAAAACKVWPKDRRITIAAFAYANKVAVLLVDTAKKAVVADYQADDSAFVDFGVAQDGLRIDTARYDLAPDVRAIGIDVTEQYHPNCGDGGIGPARTLFVQEGKTLRPVLKNFLVSTWTFVKGGNPRCGAGDEETVIATTFNTIAVGKTSTHGYADLIITSITDSGGKPEPGQAPYTLRYDGREYQAQHK